jgi:hypothetical protein
MKIFEVAGPVNEIDYRRILEGLNEFAPGNGSGASGRWYTDDQLTDIVGDGWYNDLDVSGDIPKQQMIQEAQAWLYDQGYSVHVLNCKVNDDDMEWFIEGSFQNSGFAKKVYIDQGLYLSGSGGATGLTINATGGNALIATGSVIITGSLSVNGNNITSLAAGAFYSSQTQSGSSAVSQSMTFNNTSINENVNVNSNTQLTVTNSGTYNIQFSAQLLADTGADTIYIWLKKNGSNVSNSATKLVLANNESNVAAWNFVENANANDYFELCWQSANGDAVLLAENSSGNVPAIPSVIATVTQVN